MEIRIQGLEIYAYHGVLAEEKTLGQPFVFDIELFLGDDPPGCETDRVEDTVNYAEVIKLVHEIATRQSFNLLEKLAAEVGKAIARSFPSVDGVEVSVRKTRPPIAQKVAGVGVSHYVFQGQPDEEPEEEDHARLVYLGLGSNEGDSQQILSKAIEALGRLPGIEMVQQVSNLYRTAPIGMEGQPEFLNLVVAVLSRYRLRELLAACHAIEAMAGRVRRVRWGPRPLDIDILWACQRVVQRDDLEVPHPRMEERRFVLEPLAEIAPGLVLPSGRTVEEALSLVQDQQVERLPAAPPR